MIKKCFGLSVLLLSIISFSFASYESQCEGITPTQRFEIGYSEEINNSNGSYFELKSEANLLFNDSDRLFHYGDNDNGLWFFWNNQKLYYLKTRNGGVSDQGFFSNYTLTNYGNTCAGATNNIENFYSNSDFSNPDGFNYFVGSYYVAPCFEYSDLNINVCFWYNNLTGSLGITTGDLNNLSSLYGYSKFGFGIENVPIEVGSGNGLDGYVYINLINSDYIKYFENKGFNSDICYVGTFDLSSNYGSGTQYYQGSGYTIFDFYGQLFNTSSFSIKNAGIFVNSWVVNFDTFFMGLNRDSDGNPWFVDYYNGPSDYGVNKGLGLTSPFSNNKVAYYFMSSTIRDLVPYEENIGEQVALYCYYKGILSSDGHTYSIEDNHNSIYDNRVGVYKRNFENSGYFGSSGELIVAQSWEGTPLDYFDGEDDLDFKTFFSNAFNRFKVNYGTLNESDLGLGFLPSYIVLFLLAVVLFKFLRK